MSIFGWYVISSGLFADIADVYCGFSEYVILPLLAAEIESVY